MSYCYVRYFCLNHLTTEFIVYNGKYTYVIHKYWSINTIKKAVVSTLGYERSEPGFESRRPESDFSSTQLN